jgi:hypothetical protein
MGGTGRARHCDPGGEGRPREASWDEPRPAVDRCVCGDVTASRLRIAVRAVSADI